MKRHVFAPHLALADKFMGLSDWWCDTPNVGRYMALFFTLSFIIGFIALFNALSH